MAYCTPKAFDFVAFRDGIELAWNDREGLQARWNVAHALTGLNLLRITPADAQRIALACVAVPQPVGLSVQPSRQLAALMGYAADPVHVADFYDHSFAAEVI